MATDCTEEEVFDGEEGGNLTNFTNLTTTLVSAVSTVPPTTSEATKSLRGDPEDLLSMVIIGTCLGLLGLVSFVVAWRARGNAPAAPSNTTKVKLLKPKYPPGFGPRDGTEEGGLSLQDQELLQVILDRQEQAKVENPNFMRRRNVILMTIFAAYVAVCIGVPLAFLQEIDCDHGVPWRAHLIFLVLFLATKAAELWMYRQDPTLADALPLLLEQRFNVFRYLQTFELKYCLSFMAFFDAYQDAVATVTAFNCTKPIAQLLVPYMLGSYIIGVVILQWGVALALSLRDPTSACLLKLLHMDSVALRLTLPPSQKKSWIFLHLARTIGEDVPQAITQIFFVRFVKENPFMILSICCAVGSSAMAVKDAVLRKLVASTGVEKQLLLQAADKQVKSVQCFVGSTNGAVLSMFFERRSGRVHVAMGHEKMSPTEAFYLQPEEYIREVHVAHQGGAVEESLKKTVRAIEIVTNKPRRKIFGLPGQTYDFSRAAAEGQQIIGLSTASERGWFRRITGIHQEEVPLQKSGKGREDP